MVIVFQCILALDSVKNIQYVLQEYTDYDHQWFMCISSYTCGVKEWNVPYFLSMMLWHACIWSCCMWIQAPVDCCVCVIARVYACLLNRWLWRRVWRWDMLKASFRAAASRSKRNKLQRLKHTQSVFQHAWVCVQCGCVFLHRVQLTFPGECRFSDCV